MNFRDAMAAVTRGAAVRRDAWGRRRAVQILPLPWWPDDEALLLFDWTGAGDVQPFPYTMKGDDIRAEDWSIINED